MDNQEEKPKASGDLTVEDFKAFLKTPEATRPPQVREDWREENYRRALENGDLWADEHPNTDLEGGYYEPSEHEYREAERAAQREAFAASEGRAFGVLSKKKQVAERETRKILEAEEWEDAYKRGWEDGNKAAETDALIEHELTGKLEELRKENYELRDTLWRYRQRFGEI